MKTKTALLFLLCLGLVLSACGPKQNNTLSTNHLQLSVSIAPQAWLAQKIGGEYVLVQSLTDSGDDPHSYEPSPEQMADLAKSDFYFSIGVEFEDAWLPRLSESNPQMKLVDSSRGVEHILMESAHKHEGHSHESTDPHIWFYPANMKQIAQNIATALIEQDAAHQEQYQQNLQKLLAEIDATDAQVRFILQDRRTNSFIATHPAWGYFAHAYDLQMLSPEQEGNEADPAHLAEMITKAQALDVRLIACPKGSHQPLAQSLADQLGIRKLVEWETLPDDWSASMLTMARDLVSD